MPTKRPMQSHIQAALSEARSALDELIENQGALTAIESAARQLVRTFEAGCRVYSCGNGGSMSDAMHFAEELTGRFRKDRRGLPAQAISDVGHLSCVANDFGYEQVFSRYLQSHGRSGDCLLAISTSGSSANILKAAAAANELGMTVISLTGHQSTPLEALSDICIASPGGGFADRVQELHIKVIHILLELIERHFFPENYVAIKTAANF
jgi:D-sedoheptulose 7-phosphate isomerase